MTDADRLLEALDAAPDDAARLALLSAAPRTVREQLNAELIYRKFMTDTDAEVAAEQAAFDGFARDLDAAPDDAARLRIIATAHADPQRGAAWLAEWRWRRTATCEDWMRRYLMAAAGDNVPELSEL
jgi:hypothetical protein